MYSGFGIDVNWSSGDVQGVAHPVADNSGYCSSAAAVEQMLTDLGFYTGPVGIPFNNEVLAAVKKFASQKGLSPYVNKAFCQALIDAWVARGQAAPPSAAAAAAATTTTSPTRYTLSTVSTPYKIAQAMSTVTPRSGDSTAAGGGWWGQQTQTTKIAILGGALVAVGGAAFLLMGGKKKAVANRRRARRNGKAPAGPKSGFGKEVTPADIRARIRWEKWAAKVARRKGHEALAQGHDLARVAYEDLLQKKIRAHEDLLRRKTAKRNRKSAGAWNVYLHGKHIDTVFYHGDMTADEVKRSLVGHDGYDHSIVVKARRR